MRWKNLFRRQKPRRETIATSGSSSAVAVDTDRANMSQRTRNDELLVTAKQQHRDGNVDEAEAVYLDILESDPDHADARQMLGLVFLERGQLSLAEQEIMRAIALDDKQAAFHSNLGNVYIAQHRIEEAYESFKQALELNPQHLTALSNAATALLSMGRVSEAKPHCLQILTIVPDDIGARLNLAVAYIEEHDVHAAIKVLREGLEIQPDNIHLQIQMASALELANQLDEALAVIEKIEAAQTGIARVSLLAGLIARRQGCFDIAEQRLKAALAQGLSDEEKVEALNQLGLTLDALGKSGDAFAAFEQSNKAMINIVGEQKAEGEAYLRHVAEVRAFFTKEKFKALGKTFATDDDFQPIFFVGFPRSGTTLMEQVLIAHPGLITTEEFSPLSAVVQELRDLAGGYPQGLDKVAPEDLIRFRQYFRNFCRESFGELRDRRVVDKLPLNIVHLGLAKLLFPQAKIIVALRDPRDACLSCFMQKFRINEAMANFLSLYTTGLAYEAVMGLWLHYRTCLDESWLEYRYEDLVANFDFTVNKVLDFIGVGWHENIHGYRETAKQRVITTPSYRDVTAPVNDRAVARWRRYDQYLVPILPLIEPYLEAFGYEKQ